MKRILAVLALGAAAAILWLWWEQRVRSTPALLPFDANVNWTWHPY